MAHDPSEPLPRWLERRLGRSPRRALPYDVGRTAAHRVQLVAPSFELHYEPLAAATWAVLCTLVGHWCELDLDSSVIAGRHGDDCAHATNRTPFLVTLLAHAAFGRSGGSQIAMVYAGLRELASANTTFEVSRPSGSLTQLAHVLSVRQFTATDAANESLGVVAWDPFVHDDLMNGRFQYLPARLVREMRCGPGLLLWLAIYMRPGVAGLRTGQHIDLSLTGRKPVIPLERLGLARVRPDRLRTSLQTYLDRGNWLQERLRAELATGVEGQLMLRITRLRAAEPGRPNASNAERHSKPVNTSIEDVPDGIESPLDGNRGHGLNATRPSETRL